MASSLRIYSRHFDGTHPYVSFLAPWWGEPQEDPASLNTGRCAAWAATDLATLPFTLVDSAEDCDVFVLSIPWALCLDDVNARAFAEREIAESGRLGKKIIIFFECDHDFQIPWPEHAIVFRFSIYSDTRQPNEFSYPTFCNDFLKQYRGGRLVLRNKSAVPTVGFCGYSPPLGCGLSRRSSREWLRYVVYRLGLLRRQRGRICHAARARAIRTLFRSKGIGCQFILRQRFAFNQWGVLQPGGTAESSQLHRSEFIANLDGTDYALCVRGLANCSIRLYEAMSLGRIPILVNTHCVLPYEFLLDWRSLVVWVEERELSQLGRIVRNFHKSISQEEFHRLQARARDSFVKWVSPEGFYRRLPRHWIPDWNVD